MIRRHRQHFRGRIDHHGGVIALQGGRHGLIFCQPRHRIAKPQPHHAVIRGQRLVTGQHRHVLTKPGHVIDGFLQQLLLLLMGGRQIGGIHNLRHHRRHPGVAAVATPKIPGLTEIATEEGLPDLQYIAAMLLPVVILITQIPIQIREALIAGLQVISRGVRQAQPTHKLIPVGVNLFHRERIGRRVKRRRLPVGMQHLRVRHQRRLLGKGSAGTLIGLIHRSAHPWHGSTTQHRPQHTRQSP